MQKDIIKKGRPRVSVNWPQAKFTFKSLLDTQAGRLCASSLRNKIKSAALDGELKVVDKIKNPTGRPELVYEVPVQQTSPYKLMEESQCMTEELAGESTPLN